MLSAAVRLSLAVTLALSGRQIGELLEAVQIIADTEEDVVQEVEITGSAGVQEVQEEVAETGAGAKQVEITATGFEASEAVADTSGTGGPDIQTLLASKEGCESLNKEQVKCVHIQDPNECGQAAVLLGANSNANYKVGIAGCSVRVMAQSNLKTLFFNPDLTVPTHGAEQSHVSSGIVCKCQVENVKSNRQLKAERRAAQHAEAEAAKAAALQAEPAVIAEAETDAETATTAFYPDIDIGAARQARAKHNADKAAAVAAAQSTCGFVYTEQQIKQMTKEQKKQQAACEKASQALLKLSQFPAA